MPPPMSWALPGSGSLGHIQTMTRTMARTPQIEAGITSFTVSSRKNAAVKTAASTGDQPGPGIRIKYCGAASIGEVMTVSR